MPFGLPSIGEGNWGQKVLDSINAVKATADAAASKKKAFHGAQMLAPTREPVLSISRAWPNLRVNHRVVWAQGNTAYSVGEDNSIRKTTDGGLTWNRQNGSSLSYALGYRGAFLKLANGNLLSAERTGTAAPTIRRSTDDGATWTTVYTHRASDVLFLSPQSWCQDATTGNVYLIEYQTLDAAPFSDIRILRSTDNGATWSTFHAFDGPTTSTATKVRHGHAAQYDSVSGRVFFCVGDVEDSAGIYRVNSGGTDVEAISLNSGQGNGNPANAKPLPRAVSLMFFPTHIAWLGDDTYGNLCRIARTDLGTANPTIEYLGFSAGSSGWGSIKASADGSIWIASSDSDQYVATPSNSTPLDYANHLFAVQDNGSTISELAAQGVVAGTKFTGVVPVGQAEIHGEDFWLQSGLNADSTTGKPQLFRARGNLAFASRAMPIFPTRRPTPVVQYASSGVVTVPAGGTVVFFEHPVPPVLTRFWTFDGAKYHQSGTGTCVLEIIRTDTSAVLGSIGGGAFSSYWRASGREADEFWLNPGLLPAGTVIRFQLRETGGAASEVCAANVAYGFGLNGT